MRDTWNNGIYFIALAIISAVGYGNLVRFVYLAGKHGGAFLVWYVIMFAFVGKVLLTLEIGLGQMTQQGAIGAFSSIHHRLSGIGLAAILCGFIVVSYYNVIMAWNLLYVVYSPTLKWGINTKAFFFNHVLHLSQGVSDIGYPQIKIVFALFIACALTYIAVREGVKSLEKTALVIVPLSAVLFGIVFFRSITLPGSLVGIAYYLKPDFSAIFNPSVICDAISQIFFSLSLGFGIMIAYASHNKKSDNLARDSLIISVANSAISVFLCGPIIFGVLGHMAIKSGKPIAELAQSKGLCLAFITLPEIFTVMPGGKYFGALFFLMTLALAIGSAVSLDKAVITVISDKYPNVSENKQAFCVCFAVFAISIIFTTSAGLYYLDIVDHFITNYGLVIVGLFETIAIGWLYNPDKLRKYINERSDYKINRWCWNYSIKYFIPACMIVLIFAGLRKDFTTPYGGYPQWANFCFGGAPVILVLSISFLFSVFYKRRE